MTKAERIIEICATHEDGNMSRMAEKVGVTPAYISKLKKKTECEPSESFLRNVARLYRVNEEWLRDGTGEPYADKSKEEEIAQFIGEVEMMEDSSSIKQFISILARMNKEQRDAFEVIGRMLLNSRND